MKLRFRIQRLETLRRATESLQQHVANRPPKCSSQFHLNCNFMLITLTLRLRYSPIQRLHFVYCSVFVAITSVTYRHCTLILVFTAATQRAATQRASKRRRARMKAWGDTIEPKPSGSASALVAVMISFPFVFGLWLIFLIVFLLQLPYAC